jgi:uncharacterized protein
MDAIMKAFQKNTPTLAMRHFFARTVLDGKTRATTPMPLGPSGSLDKIKVPFVVVQNPGHLNLHQFGAYDLFENAGTPADRKWLILSEAQYELPCYHWQLEALAFYDYLLCGAENGYREQTRVRYWTEGVHEYRSAANFPVPGSEPVRFYPVSAGEDAATHRLSYSDTESGTNHWAAIPPGAAVAGGLDEAVNQILSYEIDIREEVEFTGSVTASLRFSCNEIDSHVLVRTGRVDRAGNYTLLSLGSIRPACRKIDAARSTATEIAIDIDTPEPLTRGEPVMLKFSLTPYPVVLKSGDKLRVDIGSRTDLLCSDQSHDHAQFDMQVPPYFSRNTIHYGPETHVELSWVPSHDALAA